LIKCKQIWINMIKYLRYTILLSILYLGSVQSDFTKDSLSSDKDRDARQFSLFSIVTFKNDQCTTAGGLKGTCMTASECAGTGTASGNCAASFGVCCYIKVDTCGGTVSRNCTYIESPSYPSDYSTTGDCSYTVNRCQDDICQIRLDFTSVSLQQPKATGTATTDADCSDTILDITGGLSANSIFSNPPNLCGTLTGQHVYIDSGRASTAATLKFTLATSESNSWRIKVTQIECWSPTKAPQGCLQYYYGDTRHTVTSFNYDGTSACSSGCLSDSQSYSVCFRPEKGMCGMQWSQTEVSSSLSSFAFRDEEAESTSQENGTNCDSGYIQFHGTEGSVGDRWCGIAFNSLENATTGGTMHASGSNWNIMQVSVEEAEVASQLAAGFSLIAQQKGCYSAFGGDVDNNIVMASDEEIEN